ncbi:MAG: class I SAM-dependent methyltransferase [Chloroflexota bacterium]|nr:class I SAM-dependent methyltransferase [Chloroflexota bacterium]
MTKTPKTPMNVVLEEDDHWWFASRTRAILNYLDRYVGPGQDKRILDVGCGAGNMAHHLAHYGRVTGLDLNPKPLKVAQERGLEVRQGSADDLPFDDNSFDLITLLDTVEHVPNEHGVFSECYRVLKPGGKLLVTVPALMWLWSQNDVINAHQRRYTQSELNKKLEHHGFKVLRSSYNNFFLFPLAASLILARRGRAEPELASPHFDEDVYQVEMEPAPPGLNGLLTSLGKVEASLMQSLSLPIGTSILCIAERKQ